MIFAPMLKQAMNHIRNNMDTGCVGNLYAVETHNGNTAERTFSLSVWDSEDSLVKTYRPGRPAPV